MLTPLYSRSRLPVLPARLHHKLRRYRAAEIRALEAFLGGADKRVWVVSGSAGIGQAELVQVTLPEVPAAARRPVLWWDCRDTDTLTEVASEWNTAWRDASLANLSRPLDRGTDAEAHEARERELLAHVMTSLSARAHTVVLNHLERWLGPDERIRDPRLEELFLRLGTLAGGGKVLVTTDQRPVVAGELRPWLDELILAGLHAGDAVDFMKDLMGVEQDEATLTRLAEHYQGHPMALQLLAAGLEPLTREQREHRVRQLLQAREGALDRADLGPLFSAAYQRLPEIEKTALNVLAVVRRAVSPADVRELGFEGPDAPATDELRRALERLAGRSFLAFADASVIPEARYAVGEVVREYVLGELAQAKAVKLALHSRAFDWYAARFPESRVDTLAVPEPEELEAYNDAVEQGLSVGELGTKGHEATVRRAVALLLKLRNWQVLRGDHRRAYQQLRRAQTLVAGDAADAPELHAGCLERLGDLLLRTARLAEAERSYQEALPLFRKIEDRKGEANTLRSLGDMFLRTDRLAQAEKSYQEALPLFRKIEHRMGEANTLRSLGDMFLRTDRLAQAETSYQEALPLFRKIEHRMGEANTLRSLGDLFLRTDRLAAAERSYQEALPLFRKIEDQMGEANTLMSLGDMFLRTDRLAEAERSYQEALPLFRKIEERMGEANPLNGLGNLALAREDAVGAFRLFKQAGSLSERIGYTLGAAAARVYMARAALAAGRGLPAAVLSGRALLQLRAINDRHGQKLALAGLAQAWHALERPDDAAAAMWLAWRIGEDIGDPSAARLREALGGAPPTPEMVPALEQAVLAAHAADEQRLKAVGEDPEQPWN